MNPEIRQGWQGHRPLVAPCREVVIALALVPQLAGVLGCSSDQPGKGIRLLFASLDRASGDG